MSADGELIEVAFVADEPHALMIQALLEEHGIPSLKQQVTPSGPALGYGLLNPSGGSQRVMVHADRADRARTLLEATMAEGESALPESANAEYLADAEGRKPRDYSVIGGYARAFFWSFAAMALAFAVFMLVRAL
jgi:hypothetical protein